jgi:mRNA interferase MazF
MRPSRGEVWFADLQPTRGHEQDGVRPVLVVSVDLLNHSPGGMAVILPVTSRFRRRAFFRVPVRPPDGGVRLPSFALCDQVRAVSTDRLERRIGSVSDRVLAVVGATLALLFGYEIRVPGDAGGDLNRGD